jgi:hypothetical protein
MTPANWAEVVDAKSPKVFEVKATVPVALGKVIVLVAVGVVPVILI